MDVFLKQVKEDPKIIEQLYSGVKDKCILNSFVIQDLMFRASTKLLANSMNGIVPGYAYYYDYLTQNIRDSLPGAPPYIRNSICVWQPRTHASSAQAAFNRHEPVRSN
ncbi:hypothetical protein [Polynucleobacter necessarius]|uniref:hypothetical protein n=1 Tax=Polynucleobacter necessarius TaxID=576610 RepID=UPI000E0980B7|nr:hypothetical protein [Polynucleobacter necessarius]